MKYSPDGSTIRIVVSRGPQSGILEVIDQGPGIGGEHREHVFERFYRIDRSRSGDSRGTGLGLSIAQWAIEVHGGRIELESEEGRRSTSRVFLPVERDRKRKGADI